MEKLLKLLDENARLSNEQMAVMLGMTPEEVAAEIDSLEKQGIIRGYKTVINWDKTEREYVTALIELKVTPKRDLGFDEIAHTIAAFEEVQDVYLMSGGFDVAVMINGRTFQEIAMFVAKRLSPLESVLSTATHFVLSRYKEKGLLMNTVPPDERRNILL
nr:Lrp/AsnC family transcriptional regulator [uncultured Solibaculum sp.]